MKKIILYFIILTLSAVVAGCEKNAASVSLETIAYSKEYATYKKVFHDKSMFLATINMLDFEALRNAAAALPAVSAPNDYPRDSYDHIKDGREYLQHSINVRVSLNALQKKYGFFDISDEDADKVRDLYAIGDGPSFSEEDLLEILKKKRTND
jgi:hypothetical protein